MDPGAFVVIVPPGAGNARPGAPTSERIADFPEPPRWIGARPVPSLPAPRVAVIGAYVPKPPPIVVGRQHKVTGRASWYCRPGVSPCTSGYRGGLYAAAGSEIRIGNWRGRLVNVCSGGRCVIVRLIDWCACGGPRVIDLYSDAFRQIGSLSQGTLPVTVRW
jgi:rare lipoprotein A (peptidoglycan hydrolase)